MALSKLRSLKPGEIPAVLVSAAFLIAAEIQIRLSSSEKILKSLQTFSPARSSFLILPFRKMRTTRVVSLVEAVDRNLGWKPSCVRRTLALARISSAMGWAAELKIGAQRQDGNLRAHSWLELDGMRLEMDDEAAGYLVLS